MAAYTMSFDGIVEKSFGDSWLKKFDPGAKKKLVQFPTISFISVHSMLSLIRNYCKTGTPPDNPLDNTAS